jgi:hypothetical protein
MKETSALERIGEESSLSYIPKDLVKVTDFIVPIVGTLHSFIRATDESIAGVLDYCSGAPLKKHSVRLVRVFLRGAELFVSSSCNLAIVYGAERLYNLVTH